MAKTADDKSKKNGNEGKNDPPADNADDKKPDDKKAGDDKSDKKAADKKEPVKSYTEDDLERARQEAIREYEAKAKQAEEDAKLSKEELLQKQLEEAKRENQMLKAEGDMVKALKEAGAKAPELLFKSVKSDLEFDDAGKLKNLSDLVEGLKKSYPDMFGIEKPNETIDGGKGSGEEPKGKPETLKDALKAHYNK